MEEETVFETQEIKITNKRAMIRGKTFAMSNVTSVSKIRKDDAGCMPIILVVAGAALFIGGVTNFSVDTLVGSLAATVFGVVLMLGGFYTAKNHKPTFIVQIGSSSGETNALQSKDETYIQNIVEAMNKAIVLNK